ncbi:uncharacterized protein PV09_04728 [Verruconis gallopava]|uniref:Uncharacterized protein n=1 Tax=Verruconis gallopava TaxID=253628 RepID=A0A0D2AC82_9PEZI|nr:uncharacterized protein PV09_04728 [Verruconis gallopava]KIW04468.1 hypothetical protein PV09_04728 [Verruconis gallopava]
MGNGAKAAQRRERKAADEKKGGGSQLKSNAAAQTIKCKVCFQTFQSTSKPAALQEHVNNKHEKKTYADCF